MIDCRLEDCYAQGQSRMGGKADMYSHGCNDQARLCHVAFFQDIEDATTNVGMAQDSVVRKRNIIKIK